MNKFFVVVLAFAAVVGAVAAGSELQQLCSGKPIELKTVGDLVPLVDALKAGQSCSEEIKSALLELESIVKAENVCSVEVAKKIADYQQKPESVRELFLSVGLEISKLCERELIETLNEVSDERIAKDDAKEMIQYTKKSKDATSVVGGDDLQIQNLAAVLESSAGASAAVGAQSRKQIDRIKSLCLNDFKPIYEKLIEPLAILASAGLEYTSGDLVEDRDNFREEHGYQNWFRVVAICEAALKVKLTESTDGAAMTISDSTDSASVESGDNKFDLKVRLAESTDLSSSELKKEVESAAAKKQEAEDLQKLTLERVSKSFEKLAKSGKVKGSATSGIGRVFGLVFA